MGGNFRLEMFEAVFGRLVEDDEPESDAPSGPADLPHELVARVRAVARRAGTIDGVDCAIEETPESADRAEELLFVMRGYLEGWFDLTGGARAERDAPDLEDDVHTEPPLRYTLVPTPDGRGHFIVGMRTRAQADEFFCAARGLTWHATRMKGRTLDGTPSGRAAQSRS